MSTGFDYDEPGGFGAEDLASTRRMATERINLPSIFLIVVASLNLLVALGLIAMGLMATTVPAEEIAKQPTSEQAMKEGWTPEQLKNLGVGMYIGWGAVALIFSLVTLLAAIYMRGLRFYGLAITGAVLAALPIISPMGCCLLGEAIGLWALLVLINPTVRSAFRRAGETTGGADIHGTGSEP
jgi:hypothetical protein